MMQCQSKITVITQTAPYAWWLLNGHHVGPTVTPTSRKSESAFKFWLATVSFSRL